VSNKEEEKICSAPKCCEETKLTTLSYNVNGYVLAQACTIEISYVVLFYQHMRLNLGEVSISGP